MDIKIINSDTGTIEGKQLSADVGEYLIGRHADCGIILDRSDISRVHGRILCRDGGFYYTDLGSSAGSWINNEAAEINHPYLLKENDTLRLGSYLIAIENVAFVSQKKTAKAEAADISAGAPDGCWWQGEDLEVTCKRVICETEDVRTFIFTNEAGKLFSYKPGQFITLHLSIDGKPIKRSYSISSTPTRPHTLEVTVKRVPPPGDDPEAPPGLVSNWLHDNIQPGSRIAIGGPMGKFTCCDRAPDEKLFFVSAGSGITPMMSMTRWLLDRGSDADIVFFHSARTPRDIIFQRELELLSVRHPNLKLAIAATRSTAGNPWMGFTGRLDAKLLETIAPDFRERVVYTCGPDSFMKQAKTLFAEQGFPMENYFQESFGGPKRKPAAPAASVEATAAPAAAPPAPAAADPAPPVAAPATPAPAAPAPVTSSTDGAPVVVFAISKGEFPCSDDKSILDVALEEGIEIDHACCSGACGTCQVKLISGNYKYLQDPSFEPEAGHILTCVAAALGRVEIEA